MEKRFNDFYRDPLPKINPKEEEAPVQFVDKI